MTFFNFALRTAAIPIAIVSIFGACDGRRQGKDHATFIMDTVAIESKEAASHENGLATRKTFAIRACLIDSLARTPLPLAAFSVGDGETEIPVMSDNNGCIRWSESHGIDPLLSERFIRLRRSIKGTQAFVGTLWVDLALNPWKDQIHDMTRFTPPNMDPNVTNLQFHSTGPKDQQVPLSTTNDPGIDAASFPEQLGAGHQRVPVGAAETFLADIGLAFLGHDKEKTTITNLLTLKPAQKFQLRMNPQFILRGQNNDLQRLDLKGGEFNLWIVVLRKAVDRNITPADLVAEFRGPVQVLFDGSVVREITLNVHDTAATLSRNYLFVALEPRGMARETAKPGYYTGYISPLRGNDADVKLIPFDQSVDRFAIAQAVNRVIASTRNSPKPMEVFERHSGLIADAQNGDQLKDFARQGQLALNDRQAKTFLATYCDRVFGEDAAVEVPRTWFGIWPRSPRSVNARAACARKPDDFISAQFREVVDEVVGRPRHLPQLTATRPIRFNRAINYARNTTRSGRSEFTQGYFLSADGSITGSLGMNLGTMAPETTALGRPVTGNLGANVGFGARAAIGQSWNYVSADARVADSSVGASITEEQVFVVVMDAYEIEAMVRKCTIVSAKVQGGRGYYSCDDKPEKKTFTEVYHLVNHSVGNSPLTDDQAADGTRWRMTIRGRAAYAAFERMLTAENTVLRLTEMGEMPYDTVNLLPDFKVTQEFPGLVPIERP